MKVNRNTTAAAAAIAGRSAGSVTSRKARSRLAPSIARRFLRSGVEVRPEAADGAHHHRVVEEHVRDQDRAEGLVEPEAPSGPPSPSSATNADAHDDRRQHERHGHERAHDAAAPGTRSRAST